jgi:hypothetical protein
MNSATSDKEKPSDVANAEIVARVVNLKKLPIPSNGSTLQRKWVKIPSLLLLI